MNDINKVFFCPGDKVTVKHDIENKPIMIVSRIVKFTVKNSTQDTGLSGVICWWFNKTGDYVEQKFNTKDLIHSE